MGYVIRQKVQSNVRYGDKTSEHGHYAPDPSQQYGGTNVDGSKWQSTYYKWVDTTPQSAPAAAPPPQAAPTPQPKPTAPPKPVEHSPEIKQAKEKVTTYENDVLSGKVSEDVYDASKSSYIKSPANNIIQNFDFSKNTFDSQSKSEKSAQSFLNSKKEKVKQKYGDYQGIGHEFNYNDFTNV